MVKCGRRSLSLRTRYVASTIQEQKDNVKPNKSTKKKNLQVSLQQIGVPSGTDRNHVHREVQEKNSDESVFIEPTPKNIPKRKSCKKVSEAGRLLKDLRESFLNRADSDVIQKTLSLDLEKAISESSKKTTQQDDTRISNGESLISDLLPSVLLTDVRSSSSSVRDLVHVENVLKSKKKSKKNELISRALRQDVRVLLDRLPDYIVNKYTKKRANISPDKNIALNDSIENKLQRLCGHSPIITSEENVITDDTLDNNNQSFDITRSDEEFEVFVDLPTQQNESGIVSEEIIIVDNIPNNNNYADLSTNDEEFEEVFADSQTHQNESDISEEIVTIDDVPKNKNHVDSSKNNEELEDVLENSSTHQNEFDVVSEENVVTNKTSNKNNRIVDSPISDEELEKIFGNSPTRSDASDIVLEINGTDDNISDSQNTNDDCSSKKSFLSEFCNFIKDTHNTVPAKGIVDTKVKSVVNNSEPEQSHSMAPSLLTNKNNDVAESPSKFQAIQEKSVRTRDTMLRASKTLDLSSEKKLEAVSKLFTTKNEEEKISSRRRFISQKVGSVVNNSESEQPHSMVPSLLMNKNNDVVKSPSTFQALQEKSISTRNTILKAPKPLDLSNEKKLETVSKLLTTNNEDKKISSRKKFISRIPVRVNRQRKVPSIDSLCSALQEIIASWKAVISKSYKPMYIPKAYWPSPTSRKPVTTPVYDPTSLMYESTSAVYEPSSSNYKPSSPVYETISSVGKPPSLSHKPTLSNTPEYTPASPSYSPSSTRYIDSSKSTQSSSKCSLTSHLCAPSAPQYSAKKSPTCFATSPSLSLKNLQNSSANLESTTRPEYSPLSPRYASPNSQERVKSPPYVPTYQLYDPTYDRPYSPSSPTSTPTLSTKSSSSSSSSLHTGSPLSNQQLDINESEVGSTIKQYSYVPFISPLPNESCSVSKYYASSCDKKPDHAFNPKRENRRDSTNTCKQWFVRRDPRLQALPPKAVPVKPLLKLPQYVSSNSTSSKRSPSKTRTRKTFIPPLPKDPPPPVPPPPPCSPPKSASSDRLPRSTSQQFDNRNSISKMYSAHVPVVPSPIRNFMESVAKTTVRTNTTFSSPHATRVTSQSRSVTPMNSFSSVNELLENVRVRSPKEGNKNSSKLNATCITPPQELLLDIISNLEVPEVKRCKTRDPRMHSKNLRKSPSKNTTSTRSNTVNFPTYLPSGPLHSPSYRGTIHSQNFAYKPLPITFISPNAKS